MHFKVKETTQLPYVAEQILALDDKQRIYVFYGDMGAGKTTLINVLCDILGVQDQTSSPTFSIVNEYQAANGKAIYHFDFYRIKSEAEAYDLGYEEYFYSGDFCFIEWPEKIPSLLPDNYVKIEIVLNDNNEREIEVTQIK